MFPLRTLFLRIILSVALVLLPGVSVASSVADAIRSALTQSEVQNAATDYALDANTLVPRVYALRDYAPAWNNPGAVEALFKSLQSGVAQGYRPQDFHYARLQELYAAAQSGSADAQAGFDILATDAAVTLLHHLVFGKVDPAALDSDWNFSKPVLERDPASVINQYIDGDGFDALVALVTLKNPQYSLLLGALAQYKAIRDAGGWPMVPSETVLKPGMSDPAVPVLRARLAAEGVQLTSGGDPMLYDDGLVAEVMNFQTRHGLDADGVIGARTFASFNQPIEDRINKLRLSLERGRWILRDLDSDFVLVNIAGARTYLVRADGTLWTTRSITGSAYRKTPVFRDDIKYMEFNPTWTVPNSIFRKDKLSRIRKDVGYLERNGYSVRNRNGETISASSVNWNTENPPVTLVQKPGANNALGLVKFMFPNEHAAYLHDTDNRALFDQNERNLSSGCVRIEYPFEFASLLMESDPDWSAEKMQEILDSGKTTRVNLPEPMPVLLTYWTAWVEEGDVHFREDPYERDAPILRALDADG